jgi:hypothetical protein
MIAGEPLSTTPSMRKNIYLRFRNQEDDRNEHDPRPDQKNIEGPSPGDVIVDESSYDRPETYAVISTFQRLFRNASYLGQ